MITYSALLVHSSAASVSIAGALLVLCGMKMNWLSDPQPSLLCNPQIAKLLIGCVLHNSCCRAGAEQVQRRSGCCGEGAEVQRAVVQRCRGASAGTEVQLKRCMCTGVGAEVQRYRGADAALRCRSA